MTSSSVLGVLDQTASVCLGSDSSFLEKCPIRNPSRVNALFASSTGAKFKLTPSTSAETEYERRDRNPLPTVSSTSSPPTVKNKSAVARVPMGVPSRRGASTQRVNRACELPFRTSTTPVSTSNEISTFP